MKIIAEIGSNWKTIFDCYHSIAVAAKSGADFAKFQFFSEKDLYGVGSTSRQFSEDQLLELNNQAKQNKIGFMCTAFSPEGYRIIDRFVEIHKIASAEATSPDILSTVNSFKKPVLLSTGGLSFDQIEQAVAKLSDCFVTVLFCVADYPAKIIEFPILTELASRGFNVGYSDHSIDVLNIPKIAKSLGATWIEKHVNFLEYQDTPDAGHSLNELEFKMMVDNLNGKPIQRGIANQEMIAKHQRRLITLPDGTQGYFRLR